MANLYVVQYLNMNSFAKATLHSCRESNCAAKVVAYLTATFAGLCGRPAGRKVAGELQSEDFDVLNQEYGSDVRMELAKPDVLDCSEDSLHLCSCTETVSTVVIGIAGPLVEARVVRCVAAILVSIVLHCRAQLGFEKPVGLRRSAHLRTWDPNRVLAQVLVLASSL